MTLSAQATTHAIVLIGSVVSALAVLVITPRRRGTPWRWIGVLALGLAVSFAGFLSGLHLCYEGGPTTQWLLPGVGAALAFRLADGRLRWGTIVLMGVLSIALSGHFARLVHEPGWTGSPTYIGEDWVVLGKARSALRQAGRANPDEPPVRGEAGWLRLQPIWPHLALDRDDEPLTVRVPGRAWHTWFTGLHPYDRRQADLWSGGGAPEDMAASLELLPRDALGGSGSS